MSGSTLRRRQRRQRGATLLEIMFSMAVVLIGMLLLFKVLSVASVGSQSSQRMSQGLSRAQMVLESMRLAPRQVLDCLQSRPSNQWSACETLCKQWMTASPAQTGSATLSQTCVFSTLANAGDSGATFDKDGTQQQYAVVYDVSNYQDGSSWVQSPVDQTAVTAVPDGGAAIRSSSIYDAQVTIGWKEDGTASSTTTCGVGTQHCVTLRTAIYRDPR